jgi:hypothetical protein
MTAQTWSSIAEFLGIVSSAVLLIPAIALNRHLRDVHDTEKALVASTTELFKAVGQAGAPTLDKAKIPNWSRRDQNLLVLGIVSFGLSCLIKLVVAMTLPAAPPQATSPPVASSEVDRAASR